MKRFFQKNKKRRSSLLILAILIISLLAGIVLVKQNQDIREEASVKGCKHVDNARECGSTCSPNNYKCRWDSRQSRCEESGKPCDSPWIPPQASQVPGSTTNCSYTCLSQIACGEFEGQNVGNCSDGKICCKLPEKSGCEPGEQRWANCIKTCPAGQKPRIMQYCSSVSRNWKNLGKCDCK